MNRLIRENVNWKRLDALEHSAYECVIQDAYIARETGFLHVVLGLNFIVPWEDDYRHLEGNSAAHLKSSLFGVSQTILVEDGALVLGTWQDVYFTEFDGPRTRQVWIKVIEG